MKKLIIRKSIIRGAGLLLAVFFTSVTSANEDRSFHALEKISVGKQAMMSMEDEQLAAIEGGRVIKGHKRFFAKGASKVHSRSGIKFRGKGHKAITFNISFNIAVVTQTNICGTCFGDLSNISIIGQQ